MKRRSDRGLTVLETPRLVLRRWRDEDREPFAALCADPEVMRHFPTPLTRDESDAFIDAQAVLLELRGWGLWAVEVRGGAPFVGFVGLAEPQFEAHFTPCVEVGWRLAHEHWGRGYASEAAGAAVAFAFDELGLDEVVSLTTPANVRSRRVMERLGMTHDPADDFEHPRLPPGHPLRPHVLYRLRRTATGGGPVHLLFGQPASAPETLDGADSTAGLVMKVTLPFLIWLPASG